MEKHDNEPDYPEFSWDSIPCPDDKPLCIDKYTSMVFPTDKTQCVECYFVKTPLGRVYVEPESTLTKDEICSTDYRIISKWGHTWEFRVRKIELSPTKPSGDPWDPDGNPDIFVRVYHNDNLILVTPVKTNSNPATWDESDNEAAIEFPIEKNDTLTVDILVKKANGIPYVVTRLNLMSYFEDTSFAGQPTDLSTQWENQEEHGLKDFVFRFILKKK